jgi:hypothetical protein
VLGWKAKLFVIYAQVGGANSDEYVRVVVTWAGEGGLREYSRVFGSEVKGDRIFRPTARDSEGEVEVEWMSFFLQACGRNREWSPKWKTWQRFGEGGNQAQASVSKTKSKIRFELLKTLPDLNQLNPAIVLYFLIRAEEICDLGLVSEPVFIRTLLSKSGLFAQILGVHLSRGSNWSEARAALFRTFLPSRVQEQLLHARVVNRFHGNNEDLNAYLMAVKGAADILGYVNSEGDLMDRVLQNLHPSFNTHLIFMQTRPPQGQRRLTIYCN